MSDGFTGFPPEAFKFFASLAKNNNRDWFQARKDVYERACREPMKALMAAVDPPFGAGWLSRINNDMRFNRDRVPYKARIDAAVKGHYVSVGAQGSRPSSPRSGARGTRSRPTRRRPRRRGATRPIIRASSF
jgi:hypothetical protein